METITDIEKELQTLRSLKQKWYEDAHNDGRIAKIYKIGIFLGENAGMSKYQYRYNNIEIYVDDYGSFATVKADNKLVCSTHICEQIYVLGAWESVIDSLCNIAIKKEEDNRIARSKREIKKLQEEMGMEG